MKQYFIIPLILINTILSAQEKESTKISDFFVYRNEIGVNATNVLANVLSLNPNNVGTPYAIIYRRHLGKFSLRLGGNYTQDKSSKFDFSGGSQNNIELSEKTMDARIGFEYHYAISPRFMFSIGLDANYNRLADVSNTSETVFSNTGTFSITFVSNETTNGYGGGPLLRFDFKFNDRISLSTESTMYYNYSKSVDLLTRNSVVIIENNTSDKKFHLTLPQALFINVAF